jgi:hypothetical protein
MEKLKYLIAKFISNGYYYSESPTYEMLLEAIHDNYYRCIGKIPSNIFILGLVNHFVIKDVEHANKILTALKEVISESLETSGVELTYTDEDWSKIRIIENKERWGGKYILSKNEKPYMSEFFEF